MEQSTLIALISIAVTGLFILGLPIFLVIGFWVVGISLVIDFTLANVGSTLFEGLSFFGLLALPLFIMTGDLINAAGIAKRLSDFAYSVLGFARGGAWYGFYWCVWHVCGDLRLQLRYYRHHRVNHAP